MILIAIMLSAVMLSAYSCTDSNTGVTTEQAATVKETEKATEVPTDATVTEAPGTEPPTDAASTEAPATDKVTETDKQTGPQTTEPAVTDKQTEPQTTEKETEKETEPQTEKPPVTTEKVTEPPTTAEKPTEPATDDPGPDPEPDNIFKTWDDSIKSAFKTTKQTTVTTADGCAVFTFAPSGVKDPYVTFDIAAYSKLTGRKALKGADGSYIVIKFRSIGGDGLFEVFTQKPAAGDSAISNYIADGQWRYLVVDMTKTTLTKAANLTTIRLDWSGGDTVSGAYINISEIGFFDSKADAYDYAGYQPFTKTASTFTIPNDRDPVSYASGSNCSIEKKTVDSKPALEVTAKGTIVKLTVNVNTLAAYQNATVKSARYITIYYKTSLSSDGTAMLSIITGADGFPARPQKKSVIDASNKNWQGALLDSKGYNLSSDNLLNFTVEFSGVKNGVKIYIQKISVTDDLNEALNVCGKSEYALNYDASLSENDPLANKVLTAENEDPTLSLWFDQSTEKTYQNDTVSTGRTGYTVRMAKNESENCQFFLAPQKNVKVRVTVDDFKNSKGNKVQAELVYEYYHNINNTMIPDALPDLTGAKEIKAGNSQGFVIRLTTTADTPAGTYESVIHVYDDDTGKEIKRAAVAVKVWDFALSDETEIRTAFALWMSYVYDSYPSSRWSDEELSQLEDNYYSFFLKYRINIMDVPHGLTSGRGGQYMSDPRVNTARWNNLDMSVTEDNNGVTPDWMSKVIYYPGELDEPRTSEQFAMMIDRANRIKQNTPDYRMVIPFERDLYLKADGTITTADQADFDSVGFMSQYVNIWCPKLDAFTPRELGFISGASYLQSKEQDAKYGVFTERMKAEVAGGDELWTYICVNPVEPYVNWQLLSDGTETIVSLWQMKQLKVTGLLYWAVSYWKVNYWGTAQPWTGSAYGDGMLIYSGHTFGSLYPVPTLRLENIRDGIEDYQMLCMLEAKLGTKALNDMLSRITTSVLTYSSDDDYIHAVRVLLGDTLEAAYKN